MTFFSFPITQCLPFTMKVPRPDKCTAFDSQPCNPCIEDIELEKEMNELTIRIEKIVIRRRALRTAMNENHDRLIHKFPPEVASYIFLQYCPPSAFFDEDVSTSPLDLGAVCRKWRQLSWATPQLWSSILIGFCPRGRYRSYDTSDNLQFVTEWLERSACVPLTIRFDWHSVPGHFRPDRIQNEVINILNKHSAKWYDVRLDIPRRYLHHFHGSSQGNNLRRLALIHRHSLYDSYPTLMFSMNSKPSPTDLTLVDVHLGHVDIIWSNLTIASVDDIGDDECVELIRRAPLLENLSMGNIHASSGLFPFPETRIIRPHLHFLQILEFHRDDGVAAILDSVCLPSLEEWIHECPLPLDDMISPLGYLSSCLKIFKISSNWVYTHQLNRLLWDLSSLEFLELRIGHMRIEDLDFLSISAQSPLFLPHLQTLEFICESPFPWESLPQIFAPSHRRSLTVNVNSKSCHLYDDETRNLLLELVDKGFDLRVRGEINFP